MIGVSAEEKPPAAIHDTLKDFAGNCALEVLGRLRGERGKLSEDESLAEMTPKPRVCSAQGWDLAQPVGNLEVGKDERDRAKKAQRAKKRDGAKARRHRRLRGVRRDVSVVLTPVNAAPAEAGSPCARSLQRAPPQPEEGRARASPGAARKAHAHDAHRPPRQHRRQVLGVRRRGELPALQAPDARGTAARHDLRLLPPTDRAQLPPRGHAGAALALRRQPPPRRGGRAGGLRLRDAERRQHQATAVESRSDVPALAGARRTRGGARGGVEVARCDEYRISMRWWRDPRRDMAVPKNKGVTWKQHLYDEDMLFGVSIPGYDVLRDPNGRAVQRDDNAARGIARIPLGFGEDYRKPALGNGAP